MEYLKHGYEHCQNYGNGETDVREFRGGMGEEVCREYRHWDARYREQVVGIAWRTGNEDEREPCEGYVHPVEHTHSYLVLVGVGDEVECAADGKNPHKDVWRNEFYLHVAVVEQSTTVCQHLEFWLPPRKVFFPQSVGGIDRVGEGKSEEHAVDASEAEGTERAEDDKEKQEHQPDGVYPYETGDADEQGDVEQHAHHLLVLVGECEQEYGSCEA